MMLKYKKSIFLLFFILLVIVAMIFPKRDYVLLKLHSEDLDVIADFSSIDKESLISQKKELEIVSGSINSNNANKKDNTTAETLFYNKQECIKVAEMDIQDTKATFKKWKIKDVNYYNTGYYSKTGAKRLVCLKYNQIQEFTEKNSWGEDIYGEKLEKFVNKYQNKISKTIKNKDFPTYLLFPLD